MQPLTLLQYGQLFLALVALGCLYLDWLDHNEDNGD
jgi:hypothetical protein